jgi:hypothetical protein
MKKNQVLKLLKTYRFAIRNFYVHDQLQTFKLVKIKNADDLIASLNFDANATIPIIHSIHESAINLNPITVRAVLKHLKDNSGIINFQNSAFSNVRYIFDRGILDAIQGE